MADTKPSAKPASPKATLVSVEDLSVDFRGGGGNVVHAVKNVSFDIGKAETVALVGEFGLRQDRHRALHPAPPSRTPPPRIPQASSDSRTRI